MTAKECIKGRRSIRTFKPDAVSPELIRELVETASFSPSWKTHRLQDMWLSQVTPRQKSPLNAPTAGRRTQTLSIMPRSLSSNAL